MPTYIAQGKFTRDAVRGMLETPEDRTASVAKLFESLGAKLISWYMTTGEYDWLLIAEPPTHENTMAAAIAATGGGGVESIKTFLVLSGPEAMSVFQKAQGAAQKFKSAGQPAP
jgi:uncharacterized protein with GYD domain